MLTSVFGVTFYKKLCIQCIGN